MEPDSNVPRDPMSPDEMDDALFDAVEFRSTEPWPCSPPEPEDPEWLGIVIRAPRRVIYTPGQAIGESGVFARVPICGFYLFGTARAGGVDYGEMKCVARDVTADKSYFGAVFRKRSGDTDPSPEAPPVDPAELEGLVTGGYFNINLAENVPLPTRSGTYRVHVEGGSHRSNEVTIEILSSESLLHRESR